MSIERILSKAVLETAKHFKVVLVTGMRQVGKTTLLKNTAKNYTYVTLDDPTALSLAKNESALFLQTYTPPIIIDEIQYAPELFPFIKMYVDNSNQNGQILLTGSQQFSLMQGITESLAGRIAIFDLLGFSLYEREKKSALQKPFVPSQNPHCILDHKTIEQTYEIIWKGSFPQATFINNAQWNQFYSSYVKTYIERDIRFLSSIKNELSFYKFLKVLAGRTGQELNYASIAQDVDVVPNTIKQWVSLLRTSGVIYLLEPYFANINKRIAKRPKLYFMDTGLCAYLCDWTSPQTLMNGALSGAIFETFVIAEILKSYYHAGINPSIYYYRDSNKVEIDVLLFENGMVFPIEIKKTGNPKKEMIKAFYSVPFANVQHGYGSLICLVNHFLPLTQTANAINIWDI